MYKLWPLIDYSAKVSSLSLTPSPFLSQFCLTLEWAGKLELIICWDFADEEFRHDNKNN